MYFGWGVFSMSVLFHLISNVLFASRFFVWNDVTWVLSVFPSDCWIHSKLSVHTSSIVCFTSVKDG